MISFWLLQSSATAGVPMTDDPCAARATLHEVEGLALVMLCGCMQFHVRKQAVTILKEVRNLVAVLRLPVATAEASEPCVLDMMDRSCSRVIERVLPHLPQVDRVSMQMVNVFNAKLRWRKKRR